MQADAFLSPFRHWTTEDLLPGWREKLLAAAATVPPADWPGWEARYDNDCERGKRTTRKTEMLDERLQELFAHLLSPAFVAELAALTGVPDLQIDPELYGAGLHVTEPGGHLTCHLDYAKHNTLDLERRINLVLFLNPTWCASWGGALEIYRDDARQVVKRIYPSLGRAVLWEASDIAYHGTQRTDRERVTAAVYYLSQPRPHCSRKRALFAPPRS